MLDKEYPCGFKITKEDVKEDLERYKRFLESDLFKLLCEECDGSRKSVQQPDITDKKDNVQETHGG